MTTMDQMYRIREFITSKIKSSEIAIIMGCDWRTVRKHVDMKDFSSPPPAPGKSSLISTCSSVNGKFRVP